MRDHKRILGSLFIGWAALQLATSVLLAVRGGLPSMAGGWAVAWWLFIVLLAAFYAWIGVRLRAHDPRVRTLAIAFAAFALLSFPIGTAIGAYGLWVLLRRPREVTA